MHVPLIKDVIYQALVQPHFDYCKIYCGENCEKLSNKLQKLPNHESLHFQILTPVQINTARVALAKYITSNSKSVDGF
jgi:hypothetical protein